MNPHKTKKMIIQTANVDLEIQPVVRWLNKIDCVCTTNSCEGVEDKPYTNYTGFMCTWQPSLQKIVQAVGDFNGWVEMRWRKETMTTLYLLRFLDKIWMRRFVRFWLKK